MGHPHIKRRLTLTRLADILSACNGDVQEKSLRAAGVSATGVRFVVKTLDALGLTRRVGSRKKRVLTVTLAEAIARVGDGVLPPPRERAAMRRRNCERAYDTDAENVMRVLYDPLGIFDSSRFELPEEQVLPRKWRKDDKDQWAIGTRFLRLRNGEEAGVYEYDGEKVRRVDAACS